MKLVFKDIGLLSFHPLRCCGADPVSAAVMGGVSAIGSLGSSLIAADSSSSNVSTQLNAQKQENQLNRAWQTAEAEKARQYNTGERLATQQYQSGLIDKMNAYNSPENQASMYRAANVNPNLALGGQGAIVSANPSQGSPQSSPVPSGVSGLSPVGFQPLDLQIPQLLNGIGGFMKNIGEAEKLGIETDYAKASFDLNLRKLTADASSQEFYAAGLELENAIKNATKDAAIEKAFEDCKKAHWEAILTEKQGISEEVRKRVLESQEVLNKAVANYNGKNADLIKLDIEHYEQAFNMRMKIGGSQVAANYGSAAAAGASAEQTKFFTTLYKEPAVREALSNQIQRAADNALKDGSIKDEQAKLIQWQAAQLEKATNNYEIMMWSNIINQSINTVANAVGEFTKFGLVKQFLQPRGSFDPNAGRGFTINQDNGLLFRNGM